MDGDTMGKDLQRWSTFRTAFPQHQLTSTANGGVSEPGRESKTGVYLSDMTFARGGATPNSYTKTYTLLILSHSLYAIISVSEVLPQWLIINL